MILQEGKVADEEEEFKLLRIINEFYFIYLIIYNIRSKTLKYHKILFIKFQIKRNDKIIRFLNILNFK